MPHKRNPIVSEQLCGLSRLLRGYLLTSLENTALWHERDISHSSAERFLFPDACGIVLYGLRKAAELAAGLRIFEKAVRANILAAGERYHSQTVLLALSEVGLSREAAYALVQETAMRAMEEGAGLLEALKREGRISALLDVAVLEERCRLDYHIRNEDAIIRRVGLSVPEPGDPAETRRVER